MDRRNDRSRRTVVEGGYPAQSTPSDRNAKIRKAVSLPIP